MDESTLLLELKPTFDKSKVGHTALFESRGTKASALRQNCGPWSSKHCLATSCWLLITRLKDAMRYTASIEEKKARTEYGCLNFAHGRLRRKDGGGGAELIG